jgi:hypothetical protein
MSDGSAAGLTRLMKAESDAQKIIEDARNGMHKIKHVFLIALGGPPNSPRTSRDLPMKRRPRLTLVL